MLRPDTLWAEASPASWWLSMNRYFFTGPIKQKGQGRGRWTGNVREGDNMAAQPGPWPREGASQLEAGCPVELVHIWRNQLHTCNYAKNKGYIFTMDLQNRMKQCLLENPSMKYKTAFEESKAFLISRIPSKDLRKKLRKQCKVSITWWYRHGNKVRKLMSYLVYEIFFLFVAIQLFL